MRLNYYELEPEKNHFYTILVDITHKCNMHCYNCYIPNRLIPDMDKLKLFNLLKKLPFKCEIRLIGAEPTIRKDVSEIISKIKFLGHRPVLVTNGLKLSDMLYVKALKKAGLRFVGISLNGGNNDEIYKKTDGGAYAEKKIKALENLAKEKFIISTNTILLKGINENVPMEIYKKLKTLKVKRAFIRIKNVGPLGRYMATKEINYSYKELIHCIANQFKLDIKWISSCNTINGHKERNSLLFPVEKNSSSVIYIKITNWAAHSASLNFSDPNNKRRGRITQNFKIAPCFEHIKINEFGY